MATNITIGTSNDDVRKLDKSFNVVDSVSARIKEPCDILYPTFILNYDARFANCNYLKVPEWNRSYYIDNITLSSGGTMVLNCVVDVLDSFKNEIRNLTVNVSVNENSDFSDISDNNVTIASSEETVTLELKNGNFVTTDGSASNYNYVFIKSN